MGESTRLTDYIRCIALSGCHRTNEREQTDHRALRLVRGDWLYYRPTNRHFDSVIKQQL